MTFFNVGSSADYCDFANFIKNSSNFIGVLALFYNGLKHFEHFEILIYNLSKIFEL